MKTNLLVYTLITVLALCVCKLAVGQSPSYKMAPCECCPCCKSPKLEDATVRMTNGTLLTHHLWATNVSVVITNQYWTLAQVRDGTLCKTIGHIWGTHTHLTLEYNPPGTEFRECKLCHHVERRVNDWQQ
jgi:hypothetical protein